MWTHVRYRLWWGQRLLRGQQLVHVRNPLLRPMHVHAGQPRHRRPDAPLVYRREPRYRWTFSFQAHKRLLPFTHVLRDEYAVRNLMHARMLPQHRVVRVLGLE